MRRRPVVASCILAGVAVVVPLHAAASSAATVLKYPAWTPPLALPGGGAEPSIRAPRFTNRTVNGTPAAYITAPAAANSNFWRVDEAVNPDGSHKFVSGPAVNFDGGTGGGDADLSVADSVGTNGCAPVAVSGLHNNDAFANFTTAVSTDCGKTFSGPNLFAVQNVADDRQWQTFDGASTNFLIYHKVDTGQIAVSRSLDGGNTYTSLSPSGETGVIDSATLPSVVNSSQVGNIVTDLSRPVSGIHYSNGDQVHTLWAIFEGPQSPTDNAAAQSDQSYNHNDTVYIGRSDDGGVTWADTRAFGVDPSTKRELNILFPVVSVDAAGNVYAVWSDQFKVQYVVSTNGGKTWSQAYQLNHDNLGTTPDSGRADVMPWVTAGANGAIDVVWYHGEGGATTNHRDPGTPGVTAWTVAFTQLFHAATLNPSGVPVPSVKQYNQDISGLIHQGDICQNGTLCISPTSSGDRTLLDYFEVALDSRGRAIVAYASDASTPGTSAVTFTRQNGGLSATTGRVVANLNFNTPPVNPACVAKWTVPSDSDSLSISPGMQNPQLDLLAGDFSLSTDQKTLQVKLTLANLSKAVPAGAWANEYYMQWTIGGTTYFTHTEVDLTGAISYHDGVVVVNGPSHLYQDNNTDTGSFGSGPNGVVEVDVPLANFKLAVGSVIPQPSGLTEVEIGGPAGGSLQQADTGGPQYDETIGAVCPA
jgi:hypothetical protein